MIVTAIRLPFRRCVDGPTTHRGRHRGPPRSGRSRAPSANPRPPRPMPGVGWNTSSNSGRCELSIVNRIASARFAILGLDGRHGQQGHGAAIRIRASADARRHSTPGTSHSIWVSVSRMRSSHAAHRRRRPDPYHVTTQASHGSVPAHSSRTRLDQSLHGDLHRAAAEPAGSLIISNRRQCAPRVVGGADKARVR
jgi:hypothetical protein